MSDQPVDDDSSIIIHGARVADGGDIKVSLDSIIEFPAGIIGFPNAHRFVMIEHHKADGTPSGFSWLQCADEAALAFVVIDGFPFGQELELAPPSEDVRCDFKEDDEYAILLIVTVRSDATQTTANLKAPLFINIRTRKGVQNIIDDSRYSTRHPLFKPKEEETKESDKKETK